MIQQLMKVKDSYNCDALSVAGATAAIHDQGWREENQQRIRGTRASMVPRLEELGFDVQPSQANFLWCTHPDRPLEPLYEQLKSQKILVRYMKYAGWGEGLRITVGSDDQVDVCLNTLATIMRESARQ